MQTWYNVIKCFQVNFMKKGCQKKEYEMLIETVTYIAIIERVTFIITIETVMCIMHCKNTSCVIATETPIWIITVKIATHKFAAEAVTCICVAEISNCIIATETVTSISVTERSTNIPVPLQNLHKCNRRHLHNCRRKCQLQSSNRNCHLQNWLQKPSLVEMVPVWDSFSYSKEIKRMNKY